MDRSLKLVLGAACMLLCGQSLAQRVPAQPLPDDTGKAEFIHNCTACHRTEMVLAAKKTPEDWRKSVDEMASRGTDGTPEDLDKVVLYLDKYFALPADAKPVAAPPASNGPAMLSLFGGDLFRHMVPGNSGFQVHRAVQQGMPMTSSLSSVGSSKAAGNSLDMLVRYLIARPRS